MKGRLRRYRCYSDRLSGHETIKVLPLQMRSRRFVLLLLVGLSFVLGLTIIVLEILADAGFGSTSLTTDTVPTASFPSQRGFQQSFSVERNASTSLSFWEESFLYANATFHYRYSSKLFNTKYPVLQDGNNILPSVLYGEIQQHPLRYFRRRTPCCFRDETRRDDAIMDVL
jgi:hypothetical protein